MEKKELTYEKAEELAIFSLTSLARIYFLGIDRKKVSANEMLLQCPNFIKDIWEISLKRILKEL
jgi:hypothetical protein